MKKINIRNIKILISTLLLLIRNVCAEYNMSDISNDLLDVTIEEGIKKGA